MQVFDDKQSGSGTTAVCDHRRGECPLPSLAGRGVHRVIQRTLFGRLRQLQKVVQKCCIFSRNRLLCEKTISQCSSDLSLRAWRQS